MTRERIIRTWKNNYHELIHDGFETLGELKLEYSGQGAVHVVRLKISQNHRGIGLGSSLLDTAEKWAKEMGAVSIFMVFSPDDRRDLSTMKDFVQKRGFEVNWISAVKKFNG